MNNDSLVIHRSCVHQPTVFCPLPKTLI